jgi:hypothetical protein
MQRILALSLSSLPAISTVPVHAEDRILLADNGAVAAAWSQAAPSAPVPEVVTPPDGGTRIEWSGGVSLDIHNNDASGGATLNPNPNGSFFQLRAQGDLRANQADGGLNWLQFNATRSDDRALQSVNTLIGSFQGGFSGKDYQVMLGDVTPDFSSLGTQLGIRGLMARKMLGQTVLSGTAGTLAPIWNDLWDRDHRAQYLRHVAAVKLDTPLGDATRGFVTMQGYSDDTGSLGGTANGFMEAADGQLATAGIVYQKDKLSVVSEFGLSRWNADSQSSEDDRAFLLDGAWSDQGYTLRGGHHDLGQYYTSLSSQVTPGIRETYLGGDWQAATWLALRGDLRRSRNEQAKAVGSAAALTTNSAALGQVITFGADWPNLTLTLNQDISDGETQADDDIRYKGYGVLLGYTAQNWNGSLGINQRWVSNDADVANDSRTDGATLQIGRMFMDDPGNPTWSLGLQASVGYQFQKLDAGGDNQTTQYGLGLAATRQGWGSLNANYTLGMVDPTTGADLKNRGYLIEAIHPLKENKGEIKLYAQDNRNFSGNSSLYNRTRTLGAQVSLPF